MRGEEDSMMQGGHIHPDMKNLGEAMEELQKENATLKA